MTNSIVIVYLPRFPISSSYAKGKKCKENKQKSIIMMSIFVL